MSKAYLSPAFGLRSSDDLIFLNQIDGVTGFSLFWIDVVKPLLEHSGARNLLQIGAYKGEHTRLLLDYCGKCNGFLTVIEPYVLPELETMTGDGNCRLIAVKSCEAIPKISDPIDVVLLNGDLNYYTVQSDLHNIAEMASKSGRNFPVVITKSMSWPYARRDMYYDPESIPLNERHDFKRMGMSPWSPGLEDKAINAPFYNALMEGGLKNGVRTAVEDFIGSSSISLKLFTLPINYGLGIIYHPESPAADFINRALMPPPALQRLLETWEIARLNDIIRRLRQEVSEDTGRHSYARRLYRFIRRII